MKTFFAGISVYLLFVCPVIGQTTTRNIRFKSIGKDSINLHFDPDYFLIEDTCSSIVRYGYFNFKERHFFGDFRDLNKVDPQIILAEGRYNQQGKLDGNFVMHYLNGQQQAKGSFKDGVMQGDWEFFFDDGKSKLVLKHKGGQLIVDQASNAEGRKIVTDGSGVFRVDQEGIFWEGKLINGLPEGTWKCRKTDDRTGTILSSEVFKNNKFIKGSGPLGAYSDASRITLLSESLLPVNNAAKMRVSATACDPSLSRHKLVYAVYRNGNNSFSEEIKRLVGPVFGKQDLKLYGELEFDVDATINEKGFLYNFRIKSLSDQNFSLAIVKELHRLPPLQPALKDGKAIESKISFNFKVLGGLYSFKYRFLPII